VERGALGGGIAHAEGAGVGGDEGGEEGDLDAGFDAGLVDWEDLLVVARFYNLVADADAYEMERGVVGYFGFPGPMGGSARANAPFLGVVHVDSEEGFGPHLVGDQGYQRIFPF